MTSMRLTAFYWISFNNNEMKESPLTLTEKNIFWKIPESCLHHVEVTTAHTVHEGWQEVCCQAAAEKTYTITQVNQNKLSWRTDDWLKDTIIFIYFWLFFFIYLRWPQFQHALCRRWTLTTDYSACSEGPDWRPCSDKALQTRPWVSADRSANSDTRWWLTRYTLSGAILDLLFCFACLWLTVKYWMISGLLLDFSSTSVNTSNTSVADEKQHSTLLIVIQELYMWNCCSYVSVTFDRLSSWHLFQVHGHVSRTQWNRGRYVD